MPEGDLISTTRPTSSRKPWANGEAPVMVQPIISPVYGRVVFVVLGGKTAEPQATRPLPDHLYVDVSSVTKKASVVVFLVAFFSLITSLVSSFDLIHPLFSMLMCIAAVGFYIMGKMLK